MAEVSVPPKRRRLRTDSARWQTIKLLPKVSKRLTAAVITSILLGGLLPVAFNVASGALVANIIKALVARAGFGTPQGDRVVFSLAILAGLFVVQQVVPPFQILLSTTLGRKLDIHLRSRVMRAMLTPPGVGHLEDPAMLDAASLARGVGPGEFTPAGVVQGLSGIAGWYVQGLTSAILLGIHWWFLSIPLVFANLFIRYRFRGELIKIVDVMIGQARAMRRSVYFRDLALTPAASKETRVFGLRDWILDRFRLHWLGAMQDVWEQRKSMRALVGFICALIAGAYFFAIAVLARWAAHQGVQQVGQLTVLIGYVFGIGTLGNLSENDLLVENGSAAIPAALELERTLHARADDIAGTVPAGTMPAREIRFDNVTFAYPGNPNEVYVGLDLVIPAGRSLAIVGANGAGKTTLVKLLARLYDPTAGRIAIDGIDLREIDPRAWQRRIAAIFQDFAQYQMSAADNVGYGSVEHMEERDAIIAAARKAGADDFIEKLPAGWDTVLSRQYTDGADLSGGQWQRLALARALFAVSGGAGLLVLDEPTANLDVRAEAELFDRFLELTKGLTTILISHRFSTVRRADRIVVLDHGRVTEQGTHEELLALDGTYATMFHLQASRFNEQEPAEI